MNDLSKQFKKIKENSFILFVLKLLLVFLFLHGTYKWFIIPYTPIDSFLIQTIINHSESILSYLGYELLEKNSMYHFHMGIKNTSGVIIGGPCDGLSLFILFISFILVFKGRILAKILFSATGIIVIHFLNVVRIVALAIIVKYFPQHLDFHHSYTFSLIMYLIIFGLWVLRVRVYKQYQF